MQIRYTIILLFIFNVCFAQNFTYKNTTWDIKGTESFLENPNPYALEFYKNSEDYSNLETRLAYSYNPNKKNQIADIFLC